MDEYYKLGSITYDYLLKSVEMFFFNLANSLGRPKTDYKVNEIPIIYYQL